MSYWYKKNKIQPLRGFCKVIEEGSVLKASKAMNIAQSGVSLQINSLEKDLKVKLFIRKNQKLIPTEEAKKFYRMSKKFITELDFMFEHASEIIKEDHENKITIAAHPYMLSHFLPEIFKDLLKRNPKLRFELYNVSLDEGLDMLNNGTVDLGFFPVDKRYIRKEIIVRDFYKCKFGIAVSSDHPLAKVKTENITWENLKNHDYITIGKSITTQGLKSALETYGLSSKFQLHNGTWDICLGIIKQGLTVGGGDVKYSTGHDEIVFKEAEYLMPEYKFHILLNENTEISQGSKDLLSIVKSKKF
jgi:DNA-binding transcriptional LysR family regulator